MGSGEGGGRRLTLLRARRKWARGAAQKRAVLRKSAQCRAIGVPLTAAAAAGRLGHVAGVTGDAAGGGVN